MQFRLATLLIMLICALAPAALASGKKDNKVVVSFHIETEANDNPKMIFPQLANGKTRYFRRLPEISTKDIFEFSPFPSEVGDGYGIVFKLKGEAVNRFAAITNANQGRWVLSQLNGRIVDGFLIDKQVDDGFVVIWKGATLADIALFDEAMPRIGANGKKKKK